MALEKAEELISMRDHGQEAVDKLIRDHNLEEMWNIKPGTHFKSACPK